MNDLKDKTALVAGSTSGIGRATALALAAWGARVLVTGRNEQRAVGVVAEIESGGGTAAYRLTALDGVQQARDLAPWAEKAGDGHVDILVNNVGIAPGGEPGEIAAAIAYLASDEASFIHGVTIPVDGGRVAT